MTQYSRILNKIILPIGDLYRGIPIQKKYSYLKKTQFLTSEEIHGIQIDRLKELAKRLTSVPYYARLMNNLNITPNDINSLEDLRLFPKLTKEIALLENKNLQKNNLNLRTVHRAKTGGSTGEPLQYIHDKITQAWNRACHYRGLSWAGFEWGEPMICLFGGTLGFNSTSKTEIIRSKLTNQFFFPAFEVKEENLDKICSLIKRVKPKALIGYTSTIIHLCKLLNEENISLSIPIVFTTGEVLADPYRDLISKTLHCKVHDYYGFGEIQGLAYQCPVSNNYHISDEKVILEIEPVEEYKNPLIGRAIFTDLTNYSFPFVRYEPGDIVELSEEKCQCGRELTTIKRIYGRKNDFIKTSDGKVLAGIFFPHLFSKLTSIRYYQIIQENIDEITVRYIPLNKDQELENQLLILEQKIHQYTSPILKINFEEVEVLPKTPSGKLQVVISKLG